jgi:DNA-binding SARP family transcriptional activator
MPSRHEDVAKRELLRLDFLGRFRLSIGGQPGRDEISTRGRELLALLVLEGGQPISRERVASRLWPESSEGQARTNLRRELHHLRRVLPHSDRAFESSDAELSLRLGGEVRSDLHDVRRALRLRADGPRAPAEEIRTLTEVARAYGGDLLPECFAEWISPERDRLREEVVTALRRLTELLEKRGDLSDAIRWARRLTEIDPLDEIAYRAQMRLHAAASDRAAALHAFHRCVNLLERELGVEPAPETRDLYRTLVEYEAPSAPEGSSPPEERASLQAPETWALVGRAAERDRLLQALRPAEATAPRVACILGEPGIGKSRLADEVARRAQRDGAVVARARAYAVEGQLNYGPVVDWLRSPTIFPQLGDLDPVWRAEIGRLLPELTPSGREPEEEAPPQMGGESYPRRRLFEAVARALLGGSRAVVLVLDDLQWCDAETLALLHYVSRFDGGTPRLLVLATARSAELLDNEAARRLLLSVREEGLLLELELGPLDASDLAAMLRAAAGDEPAAVTADAAERIYALSEGNPLFALEALRANLHLRAAEPAPDSSPGDLLACSERVRAVLTARLAQLETRAQELAQCAATIGRAFSFEVLREAADLDERELVRALDELWRRRIVREHATLGYDFSHDALREAVTRGLGPAHARLLHRRVAQALELVHDSTLDEIAASLASHYELAGLPERAEAYYRRAARAAAAVYAHRRAEALLHRALALVRQRPQSRERDREELSLLLEQTPSLRAVHGYTDRGLFSLLHRARLLAEGLEDASAHFQVLRNVWSLNFVAGDLQGTVEIAGKLRELAEQLPELEAESHHALAGALTHVGEFETAIHHFEAARSRYDPRDAQRRLSVFGSDLGVFNAAWEAHALWMHGLEDRAVASAQEAVQLSRTLGHAYSEALAQAYAAVLHYMRGDRRACAEAADAARALCERHAFAYYRHWGTLLGAWARTQSDPAAAVEAMRGALAALDEEGARARRPIYLAALAESLAAAGRHGEALEALDQAEERVAISGDKLWSAELARLRAMLLPESATDHARRALERAQRLRARPLIVRSAVTLAEAMRRGSQGAGADDVVREALAALPDGGSSFDRERALQLLSTFV